MRSQSTRPVPVRPWHAKKKRFGQGDRPVVGMQRGVTSVGTLRRPGSASASVPLTSILADMLTIIVGVTTSFTFEMVGTVPVAEGIMLVLLPVLLAVRGSRLNRPIVRLVFALLALWLVNQILTDIYRETATRDWIRGDAAIVFFAMDLMFLVILLGENTRRTIAFVASYSIGSLLAARFQPTELTLAEPWKFGYANGVNTLAVLAGAYLYHKRRYVLTACVLGGVTAINLLQNYRSPVLNILVAVALTIPIVPERVGNLRLTPRKGSIARIVFLAATAMLAGVIAQGLVHFVTKGGFISEDAQAKNKQQSGSGIGMLLAGRPEILVSSRAILEHPILGYGSWARDFKYAEMLSDIQEAHGIQTDLTDLEQNQQGLIPAHSHLMGAWIWAGIFGAVFWGYIFWLSLKGIIRLTAVTLPFNFLHAFLLVAMVWTILFSPFGLNMRIVDAMLIVIIADLLSLEVPGSATSASRTVLQGSRPVRPFRTGPAFRRSV